MIEIALTQGQFALIDDQDGPVVLAHKWWAAKSKVGYYAQTKIRLGPGRWRVIQMQKLIMNPPPGYEVDHVSMDGCDNRRENLRVCTHSQNKANNDGYRARAGGHERRYKGVYQRGTRWTAQVRHRGRLYPLGSFRTAEEAARAYDAKARELFGEFAGCNFPDD